MPIIACGILMPSVYFLENEVHDEDVRNSLRAYLDYVIERNI